MNTRNSILNVVVILTLMMGWSPFVLAYPVYIYSSDFDLSIPSKDIHDPHITKGWMDDALIEIPDHFTICDLDVRISLKHTKVFDLQIFLQSPAGTRRCLNMYNPYDEYFDGENYTQTIFDDEAQIPIGKARPPFTGRFRPRAIDPLNKLAAFDGQDTFGPWRLQIYDAYWWNTGNLESVELIITVPEPATAILFTLATALICLHKPRGKPKNTCPQSSRRI